MNIEYLIALKQKGNFTYETIAKLSDVPEATVKNIFSGKTEDPRFETLSAIIYAMGGTLDEYHSDKKTGVETDVNVIITMKEMYEARIADLKEQIQRLQKEKGILWIAACVLAAIIVGVLAVDLSVGSIGWFRY